MDKVSFSPVSVQYHAAATTHCKTVTERFETLCGTARELDHIIYYNKFYWITTKKKDHHHADTFQEKQYY